MTTVNASHALLLRACAQAGLSTDQAELIRIGENAVWRLPHQVVARIARPGRRDVAVRELAVARWLHTYRIPAVRPIDQMTEPIVVDGHPVTFWQELPPHRPGTAADLAPLLRRFHELPIPDFPLGRLEPFVRLAERIDAATTLVQHERQWLHHRLSELQARWSALVTAPGEPRLSMIHGDAWTGNVAVTDTTAFILDFERTALGPPEWDLASTAVGYDTFGSVAEDEYTAFCVAYGADVTSWAAYPLLRDIRELRVTCFAIQRADAEPGRYQAQAHYRLACLQGRHGPRPWGWTPL